jgi:type VI secretion system protein ImpH
VTSVRGTPAQAAPSPASGNGPAGAEGKRGALSEFKTVEQRLFAEGFTFDFFQAVRVLERLDPGRRPVGRAGPPRVEVARFRVYQSLTFPASDVYDIQKPSSTLPVPVMVVPFLGLTGPNGILPRHYTELLLRQEREAKHAEKYALRDWLDLFNHRLIALFYRAWEKYRFFIPYERKEYDAKEQDPFTRGLFSLMGLGLPPLRNRLGVSTWEVVEDEGRERVLARIDDLALLHFSGFLVHRPRCAVSLDAMLRDYFRLPLQVKQFQGQWLKLDPVNQSRLGGEGGNNRLGVDVVVGERVWDVQNRIRIRLGPLRYAQFSEFIPDRSPIPERKSFFLLAHLVRLYIGPDLDFDIQLVLRAEDVPACQLAEGATGLPRLGWNTWVRSQPCTRDADDPVFEGEEVYWLNRPETINEAG